MSVINSLIPNAGNDDVIWTSEHNSCFIVRTLCSMTKSQLFATLGWVLMQWARKTIPPKVVFTLASYGKYDHNKG